MMNVVKRFCIGGELVVHTCAGRLAPVKACFQLPLHRHFVGREKDSMCFLKFLLSVVEVLAWQFLNFESELLEEEEVME